MLLSSSQEAGASAVFALKHWLDWSWRSASQIIPGQKSIAAVRQMPKNAQITYGLKVAWSLI
jgi:hypothetical protein